MTRAKPYRENCVPGAWLSRETLELPLVICDLAAEAQPPTRDGRRPHRKGARTARPRRPAAATTRRCHHRALCRRTNSAYDGLF